MCVLSICLCGYVLCNSISVNSGCCMWQWFHKIVMELRDSCSLVKWWSMKWLHIHCSHVNGDSGRDKPALKVWQYSHVLCMMIIDNSIPGVCIICFLVYLSVYLPTYLRRGSHYLAQADFELTGSNSPPVSAFWVAGDHRHVLSYPATIPLSFLDTLLTQKMFSIIFLFDLMSCCFVHHGCRTNRI